MMEVDRHPGEPVGAKISGIGLSCGKLWAKAGLLFYTCVMARSHGTAATRHFGHFWFFLTFWGAENMGKKLWYFDTCMLQFDSHVDENIYEGRKNENLESAQQPLQMARWLINDGS